MAVGSVFLIGIVFVFLGVLALLVPVLLGVWAYRDAKSREMEALLWAVVVALTPCFIGLIIYLVCRNREREGCPNCGGPVSRKYTLCPLCGQALRQERT